MRKFRTAIVSIVSALVLVASPASALIIDLDPGVAFFGPAYVQDGYRFASSDSLSDSYGNWVHVNPSYNASNANGGIFQNRSGTTTTLTNNSGGTFDFSYIGLADVYNQGTGGAIQFTFNYTAGGSSTETVTLQTGITGLQLFTFDELGLSSVVLNPLTTSGRWIQFDNIGINVAPAVPEPSTWAMMILGFLGVGFLAYRRRSQSDALTAA